ncbi:MAG: DUF2244 domain-containing protein [Parvibaculales bacterium]|nr:DUF2244 domain-containing protein [Alphaproteobacteria bacterium]
MQKITLLPDNFDLVLRPNMSLSRRGFFWLMGFVIGVSLIVGGYFWSLGAWPVFGFFGLEVILLYGAFRLNYRAGKRYETLSMADRKLIFAQVSALGAARQWEFDPYWVRIKLERFGKDGEDVGALILTSHGKYVSVGAFLAPEERETLAASLQATLTGWRNDLLPNPASA